MCKLKKKQIKRKAAPSSLPKKKENPYNTPDGGPYGKSQGIGAVNCCCEDPTPEAVGIIDFLHFHLRAM